MASLDDFLNDDERQPEPVRDERLKKVVDENKRFLDKMSKANQQAETSADVALAREINERLKGNAKERRGRLMTNGVDADKTRIAFLIGGGVIGFIIAKIVTNLAHPALYSTALGGAGKWVSMLVTLAIIALGVFFGSVLADRRH